MSPDPASAAIAGSTPLGVGIIGVGSILPAYLRGLRDRDDLAVVRLAATDAERSRQRASEAGIQGGGSVAELLDDPAVELVVVLTPPQTHASLGRDILRAGKHLFVEKPVAVSAAEARDLVGIADAEGLLIGAAPDIVLGPLGRIVRDAIDGGAIGVPFAATSFMGSSRVELWHPHPAPFFDVGGGPLLDWAPYHLSLLVHCFGRGEVLAAATRTPVVTKTTAAGEHLVVRTPLHAAGLIRFDAGVLATATYSFEVWSTGIPQIEIYGTAGTLQVLDTSDAHGDVRVRTRDGEDWREISPGRGADGARAGFRGLGVLDMAGALRGEPRALPISHALHVLELAEGLGPGEAAA